MENDKITVIVPVYNVERYLKKCVSSIINQTYRNLEIILVDDGSTDDCAHICEMFAKSDNRIRVIHKVNGGLSDARNSGLSIATGNYFSFIDGDDYIMPDTIENLYTAAIKYKCEISICNILRLYDNGKTKNFYAPVGEETLYYGNKRFETLMQPSVCNKLFRADLFNGIQFPKGKYYEDTFVYHELVYKAKRVVLTGYDGYYYLSRNDSIVGQPKYTKKYFDFIEAVWLRATFLLEHDVQPYANEACLSLYAAVSNAVKNISGNLGCEKNLIIARKQYLVAYTQLMKRSSQVSIKQRIRLILLRYFPTLHKKIY